KPPKYLASGRAALPSSVTLREPAAISTSYTRTRSSLTTRAPSLARSPPKPIRSASLVVRNERSAAMTKIASSRWVLPWPLSPENTLNRSRGSSDSGRRLRTPRATRAWIRRSDPHRHDHAEVVVAGQRAQQARVELAVERDRDLVARHLREQLD